MNGTDIDVRLIERTESTNELALSAIDQGESAGTAFVADHQTAGRGRRERDGSRRRWFSPPGKNLYLSVVVRPRVQVARAAAITLAVGVELVELLRETTGVDVQLKWPNDLYVGDRKLAGILTEAATGPSGLKGAAVGVGMNVNVAADAFPDELQQVATSLLLESGHTHDRLGLSLAVIRRIVDAVGRFERAGLEPFSHRLDRWNYLQGRAVTVQLGGETRRGVARAIGDNGGLVVDFDDGRHHEVVSGEVIVDHLRKR